MNCIPMMTTLIIIVFLVGYMLIALENLTKVNKTCVALLMYVTTWSIYMIATDYAQSSLTSFSHHLAETCETILFLMGAMTIVEVVDSNGGFNFVTRWLNSRNPGALLWKTVGLTFILSALLDNMTTAIVMTMVLRKLIADNRKRLWLVCMVVVAANAGGAFSPIGDVTTIMLWIKGCVSASGTITSLILPSLVSVAVPALLLMPKFCRGTLQPTAGDCQPEGVPQVILQPFEQLDRPAQFSRGARIAIFIIGVGGLMSVPLFHNLTGLPPFVGVTGVLAVLWTVTEIIIRCDRNILNSNTALRVATQMKKIDTSTILFFLGILLTVGTLQETGTLSAIGHWLNDTFSNVYVIDTLIGMLSSVVDNVPLVASAMGMYDIQPEGVAEALQMYQQDGAFWQLLAYCAGTGGSLLIIGSAAGVVAMGMEDISFAWYMKHITPLVLLGYFAGILCYWIMA